MPDDKFVLIGPAGWQLLGLVVIMGLIWWWLARKPGAPPPMIFLVARGLWWRLFPALTTWHEVNQERARARFVKQSQGAPLSHMSSDDEWEEDDRAVAGTLQQNNNATTTDCNAELDNNDLLLRAEAATLAKLVKAGVVGETKGLQIVFNVKPSSTSTKYQEARDALKSELAKLDPPAQITPIAGRQTRAAFHSEESGI
jgi:hypothetical protein